MFSPQRIHKLKIQNFRSIVEADVPLNEDTTVLVGENGVGKTAILEALAAALAPAADEFARRRKPGGSIRPIDLKDFHSWVDASANKQEHRAYWSKISVELNNEARWTCEFNVDFEHDSPRVETEFSTNGWRSFHEIFQYDPDTAPLIAYYGIDRGILTPSRPASNSKSIISLYPRLDRRGGYANSLRSKTIYSDVVEWFDAYEGQELRQQREVGPKYKDARLDAVRRAVEAVLPDVRNLRMMGFPPRLTVDMQLLNGGTQALALDNLSGGYRSFIAMVVDIARRMVDINPHMDNPLEAPGFVLIDEIDLHLHPRWQQVVVSEIKNTFPNIQFVLTTHSPQVVTTVGSENVLALRWAEGRLLFDPVPSIEGAKSGRALAQIMRVEERPPAEISDFVKTLEDYKSLVRQNDWDSDQAQALFAELQNLSPDDPELSALSLERRRLKALQDRNSR